MNFGEQGRQPSEIPIAPLVDIVFLLVLFFMLAGSFFHVESIDLAIPEPSVAEAVSPVKPLVVRLHGDGATSLDGVVVGALRETIVARLNAGFEGSVIVVAPDGTSIDRFVDALDKIRQGGIDDVAMAVGEGP